MTWRPLLLTVALTSFFTLSGPGTPGAVACANPDRASLAGAFDLAANGLLPATYPQIDPSMGVRTIPPSVLKAIGWVESGWHQYATSDRPLVSGDFGYGIMQVTSGMAGAAGDPRGELDPGLQSRIASDYLTNIAYGARILAQKWAAVPRVGSGNPAVVENWYYAIWAYNSWGWVNNPNNPRFTRVGTPLTHPSTFPYQERVLYLVAHPPRDALGAPMWQPVPVTLPPRAVIARQPGPLTLRHGHSQPPPELSVAYRAQAMPVLQPGATDHLAVHLINTGTQPWPSTGINAVTLTYHVLTAAADLSRPLSPFAAGVVAFGQGAVSLPSSVLPGGQTNVHVTIRAPATPGVFRLAWDLSQGSATWFSQLGIPVLAQRLQVSTHPAPTPNPTATPLPLGAAGLRFLADTSVPDGSVIAARGRFLKGWLVFNPGPRAWGAATSLRLISGPSFGARQITLPRTPPCRATTVLARLRAPARPGRYTATWRLATGSGSGGDRLTVSVIVRRGAGTPTPLPTGTPTPPSVPMPTPTAAG